MKRINTYLKQNCDYLCHYAKRKQKMQWTRESAHHVLQIRAAMASNDWYYLWQPAVETAIQAAA